jgi:hypothetical protein
VRLPLATVLDRLCCDAASQAPDATDARDLRVLIRHCQQLSSSLD